MKKTIIRFVSMLTIPILLLLYFTFLKQGSDDPIGAQQLPWSPPKRIISFAPSVTEILYELGMGENVLGVTQFCNYPPQAKEKDKIGGHVDYNYEAILRLKPDFAILLKERRDLIPFLDKHSIRYITVGSESVDEIIASIRLISKACFISKRGDSLAQSLLSRMESASLYADAERPKVLLSVSRDDIGSGAVAKVFAAGALSFYNQLIEVAGGVNIMNDVREPYPAIGAEAVIRLNPDIIIDISSAYSKQPLGTACNDWRALGSVAAVNTNGVRCLTGDYLTIPGPRFVLIAEEFRNIIAEYRIQGQDPDPDRDE